MFHDVRFVDCTLSDVDFGGATLTDLAFPGSRVERLALNGAVLKRVDLRGATVLELSDGVSGLQGATISELQLMELAPSFAHALGVDVEGDVDL